MKIPVLLPATEEDAEAREDASVHRDGLVLRALAENPEASQRGLSFQTGLTRTSLQRALARLAKAKPVLVKQMLGKWAITKAGTEALHKVGQ